MNILLSIVDCREFVAREKKEVGGGIEKKKMHCIK